MEDLIKRSDVIQIIGEIETARLRGQIDLTYAPTIKRVNDLPSADRPQGEWIDIIDANELGEPYVAGVECSNCGSPTVEPNNYCPYCGADMRKEIE